MDAQNQNFWRAYFYSMDMLNATRHEFLDRNHQAMKEALENGIPTFAARLDCREAIGWAMTSRGEVLEITEAWAKYEFCDGYWYEVTCYPIVAR